MKTLLFSLLSLLLLAGTLSAADVSGKWSGTFEHKNDQGESKSEPIYMVFKQDGNKLTGSGGPNETEQHGLVNGKVEGDRLTFEVQAGSMTINFDLKAQGDQITGDMKGSKNGNARTAKLSLKRVAEKEK